MVWVMRKLSRSPLTIPHIIYTNISELPPHIFEEMRHFFNVYKELEHKETAVKEFGGPEEAILSIEHCLENYIKKFTV